MFPTSPRRTRFEDSKLIFRVADTAAASLADYVRVLGFKNAERYNDDTDGHGLRFGSVPTRDSVSAASDQDRCRSKRPAGKLCHI
jgi:hypothetical protein